MAMDTAPLAAFPAIPPTGGLRKTKTKEFLVRGQNEKRNKEIKPEEKVSGEVE